MSERSSSDPSLSEQDISRILRRAAEMQGSEEPGRGTGLTLDDLKQIAADSGIDPRFIEQAAGEIQAGREQPSASWWGGPVSLTIDRTVDHEIDMATWERIVAEARRHFNDSGTVSTWGRALEWTLSGKEVAGHISAVRREGRTYLQIRWNMPILAVPFFVMAAVGSILSLPIVLEAFELSGWAGFGAYLAIVLPLWLVLRTALALTASSQRKKVHSLVARIDQIAREGEAAGATTDWTATRNALPEGRIDDRLFDAIEPPDPSAERESPSRPQRRDRS